MVIMGIKDYGTIDFSTPFASGKAASGFVGVTFVFFSVIVSVGALRYRALENKLSAKSEQTIQIRKGDVEIVWKGNMAHWNESHHVKALLDEIMLNLNREDANKAISAVAKSRAAE